MDPIVITTQEVAQAQIPLQGAQEVRPKVPNPVPLWTRLLFVPLVLVLPLVVSGRPDHACSHAQPGAASPADVGLLSFNVAHH